MTQQTQTSAADALKALEEAWSYFTPTPALVAAPKAAEAPVYTPYEQAA